MPASKPRLAFAGLGAMGFGMASHLIKSGFSVTGYDIYQPLIEKLVAVGGSAAGTPREAVKDVEVLVVMVAIIDHALSLLFDTTDGVISSLPQNSTVLMCSTVAPTDIVNLAQRLKDAGRGDLHLIDCPVSGGAGRAANGTLSIFASGAKPDLDSASSILECMSGKLYRVGDLGSGSKAKLIHQIFAGVQIAMASEAMGLAAAAGSNTQKAFEKLKIGKGTSWMFENRAPMMMDRDHKPYSAVAIIRKDVKIITKTAREEQFPLPLLEKAEQLYDECVEQGWEREDDCVLVRLYLPNKPNLVEEQAGSFVPSEAPKIELGDIESLMIGVHLGAMSEAMRFCEHLGIDTDLMFDIVSNAAGASAVFVKYFEEMKRNNWAIEKIAEASDIKQRVVSLLCTRSLHC